MKYLLDKRFLKEGLNGEQVVDEFLKKLDEEKTEIYINCPHKQENIKDCRDCPRYMDDCDGTEEQWEREHNLEDPELQNYKKDFDEGLKNSIKDDDLDNGAKK